MNRKRDREQKDGSLNASWSSRWRAGSRSASLRSPGRCAGQGPATPESRIQLWSGL